MNLIARGTWFLALVILLAGPALAAPDTMARAFEAYKYHKYREASVLLEQHLQNQPNDVRALLAMGLVKDKLGNYDAALKYLRRCIKLNPKFGEARETYAAVVQQRTYQLTDAGALDRALAVADEAIQVLPDEPGVHFARGAVLFERWRQTENPEDHVQALESWSRCRDLKPVSATGQILLGIAAFEVRDYGRAKEYFRVARKIRGYNRYAAMWLGLAEAALGEYEDALKQLGQAQRMFGPNPSIHRYLGDVLALQGRYEDAEKAYLQALTLKPDDPRVHAALGEIAIATGRTNDAVLEYDEAVKVRPDDFGYQFRLAETLRDEGEADKALEAFVRARAIVDAPTFDGPKARDRALVDLERALLLLEKGDRDGAVALFGGQELEVARETPPRVNLYVARVGSPARRLDAIQKALEWSGPDARQLQAEAYLAWGDLERAGNHRLDAMELYYQAWLRTPADSARTAVVRSRFDATKAEEIAALAAADASGTPNKRLEAVKSMALGDPGALANGAPVAPNVRLSVVPTDLAGELTVKVPTAPAPGTQVVRVRPSWEQ